MFSMCTSFITRSRKSQEVDNRGNPTTTKKEKKKNGLDCGKPVNYTQFDSLRGISNRKSHPHIPEPEVAMIFKKKGSRNAEVDMSDLEKKLKKSKKEVRIYCCVPARWGLQQTHPGLRAATRHGVRDPLVRSQVDYSSHSY